MKDKLHEVAEDDLLCFSSSACDLLCFPSSACDLLWKILMLDNLCVGTPGSTYFLLLLVN